MRHTYNQGCRGSFRDDLLEVRQKEIAWDDRIGGHQDDVLDLGQMDEHDGVVAQTERPRDHLDADTQCALLRDASPVVRSENLPRFVLGDESMVECAVVGIDPSDFEDATTVEVCSALPLLQLHAKTG